VVEVPQFLQKRMFHENDSLVLREFSIYSDLSSFSEITAETINRYAKDLHQLESFYNLLRLLGLAMQACKDFMMFKNFYLLGKRFRRCILTGCLVANVTFPFWTNLAFAQNNSDAVFTLDTRRSANGGLMVEVSVDSLASLKYIDVELAFSFEAGDGPYAEDIDLRQYIALNSYDYDVSTTGKASISDHTFGKIESNFSNTLRYRVTFDNELCLSSFYCGTTSSFVFRSSVNIPMLDRKSLTNESSVQGHVWLKNVRTYSGPEGSDSWELAAARRLIILDPPSPTTSGNAIVIWPGYAKSADKRVTSVSHPDPKSFYQDTYIEFGWPETKNADYYLYEIVPWGGLPSFPKESKTTDRSMVDFVSTDGRYLVYVRAQTATEVVDYVPLESDVTHPIVFVLPLGSWIKIC